MEFKKPKFWDLKKPNFFAYLLLPLTIFVRINNFSLNFSRKKQNQKIKSICVGNIYLGGTGKTPSTIKIYNLIKKFGTNVVVGKKFYKSQVDEAIILKKQTELILGKSRKEIIQKGEKNHNDVVIFDDGLQDRNILYDLKIVCFDAVKYVGNNFLIPAGPLREKINSLKKYDCIFLKDGNINKKKIIYPIKKINKKIKIFYTYFKIKNLEKFRKTSRYLVFSGIGNPDGFKQNLLKNKFNIVKEIIFPDHFNYSKRDIQKIKDQAKKLKAKIITTEKDFVKISKVDQKNINFLKVELMIKNEKDFIKFLKLKIYEKR
jgi:tetraacyldisaccharide 4'-kinase